MSKPSKVAWVPKPVDVRRLRKALFGEDRLPVPDENKYLTGDLYGYGGIEAPFFGTFNLTLFVQAPSPGVYPATGKPRHRSRHRLQAWCPVCNKYVPVGRMAQHKH